MKNKLHPSEIKIVPENLELLQQDAEKLSAAHLEALKEQQVRQQELD